MALHTETDSTGRTLTENWSINWWPTSTGTLKDRPAGRESKNSKDSAMERFAELKKEFADERYFAIEVIHRLPQLSKNLNGSTTVTNRCTSCTKHYRAK
jgi:hypothetical protein